MHISRLSLAAAALAALVTSCAGPASRGPATSGIPSSWGGFAVQQDIIPEGRYARHKTRSMRPSYITIHATENFAAAANARAHASMLSTGSLVAHHNSLGFLSWHFTVDDHSVWQSLPCNEQGQHADYEGDGNAKSIGIEMCENAGNSREVTLDRTAKLAALLMKHYGIPISNVVPHGHWHMIRYDDHKDLGYKNCPHFLLSNSQPTAAWYEFLKRIERYRAQLG